MRRGVRDLERQSLAEAFADIRSDYSAAKQTRYRRRRTGLIAVGSHADWHYRVEADYLRLMEYARDFERNDMLIGQMVTRAVDNTIQDGISPDPRTSDKGLNRALKERWKSWATDAEQCDLQGELTFQDLEKLALRQTLVDGDICALATREGALQFMEAHRLRTPQNTKKNVVHGVLLDDARRRLEYWFTLEDISPSTALNKVGQTTPVSVRDSDGHRLVFHVYHPKRVTQTRGVTAFAPAFDPCGMAEDINFATMVKQQVAACWAIIRTRDPLFSGDEGQQTGPTTTEPQSDGSSLTVQGIAPGMTIKGQPGEKIDCFSPNIPSESFFPHMTLMVRIIGLNLGLPLSIAMLDTSNTVFHGYRAEVEQAKLGFRSNQTMLINRLHAPCYAWKVRQWAVDDPAIAAALLKDETDTLRVKWHRPAWPYVDPTKDAGADLLQTRNCLNSPRRIQAARGREWDEIFPEIIDDNFRAIFLARKRAGQMNARFNDNTPVHWRELLSLPTPDGVSVKLTGQDEADAGTAPAAAPAK